MKQYPTLICSLPRLPADFEQTHVPISRPRLENRLQMLEEPDAALIHTLECFWRWEFYRPDRPPAKLYAELLAMTADAGLLECIDRLTDIRVLTVVVRARLLNQKMAQPPGRWGAHITRNWRLADFGLGRRFPWLPEFRQLLENKQYTRAERQLCRTVWQEMKRVADWHQFELPAVISYLVRWDLINRWAVRDYARGVNRFNTLVEEAIGDYAGQIH